MIVPFTASFERLHWMKKRLAWVWAINDVGSEPALHEARPAASTRPSTRAETRMCQALTGRVGCRRAKLFGWLRCVIGAAAIRVRGREACNGPAAIG